MVRRIVVAGAGGLAGRRLVERLRERGDRVDALVRREDPALGDQVIVDLGRPGFTDALDGEPDAVVHVAQSPFFRNFPASAPDVFAVNSQSVVALLAWSAARGASFVLASTGGVYARSSRPLGEDDPLVGAPAAGDAYVASKLAAEHVARTFETTMAVAIVRPFFMYGRGQRRDMLLPRLFDQVVRGESVQVSGRRGLRCNPIHVDDAVDAIVAIIDSQHRGVVNLAGPDVVSLATIVERIGEALGTPARIETTSGDAGSLIGGTARLRELGTPPSRKLLDHLDELRP